MLTLWVDAMKPVVHVGMEAATPLTLRVAYESWRFAARPVAGGLEWCCRLDPAQDLRLAKIKEQRAEAIADKAPDLLKGLTMGGRLVGEGLVADGAAAGVYMRTPFQSWKLKTAAPVRQLELRGARPRRAGCERGGVEK